MALAQKKADQESRKTPSQVKQKVQEFLLRKGYGFSVIQEVLGKIELKRDEDDWSQMIELQGDKVWRKYSQKFTGYELHMRIKQALYQKGFPSDIIEQFIETKENNNG